MGRARDKRVYMRAHDKQVEVVEACTQGMGLLRQEFEFQYIYSLCLLVIFSHISSFERIQTPSIPDYQA